MTERDAATARDVQAARGVLDPLLQGNEGYFDAMARVEDERPLTGEEKAAGDALWADFTEGISCIVGASESPRR